MAEKMDAFKEEAEAFSGENDMSCLEKLEPMSFTASPEEMAERVERITGIEPKESVVSEVLEAVTTDDAISEQVSAYTDVDMSCVEKLEPMSYTASPAEMAERVERITGIEPKESVIAEAVEAVETPDAINEQANAYTDVDMSCVEKLEPMSYTASPEEMADRIAHVTEELNK